MKNINPQELIARVDRELDAGTPLDELIRRLPPESRPVLQQYICEVYDASFQDPAESVGLSVRVFGLVASPLIGGAIGGIIGYSLGDTKDAAVAGVCTATVAFGVEYVFQPIASGFQKVFRILGDTGPSPSREIYRNEAIGRLERLSILGHLDGE